MRWGCEGKGGGALLVLNYISSILERRIFAQGAQYLGMNIAICDLGKFSRTERNL
jgi:hypothetical protein